MSETKYEIEGRRGPLIDKLQTTPGLHLYTDVSVWEYGESVGIVVERIPEEGADPIRLKELTATPDDIDNTNEGEAKALLAGIRQAIQYRDDGEHLFVYTDSRDVVGKLTGRKPGTTDGIIADIVGALPPMTETTVTEISGETNKAHEVSRR